MRYLLTAIAFILPVPSWAADPQAAGETGNPAEPPQYYQVELIVFRHLDQSGTTGEIPRMPAPGFADFLEQDLARLSGTAGSASITPEYDASAADENPVDALAAAAEADSELPLWQPANGQALLLSKTADRIAELPPYELLAYIKWAQTAPDVTVANALTLAELGVDPEQLSGAIELYQRRYLHLSLEISLGGNDSSPTFGDSMLFAAPDTRPTIKDSRRIRLEKLQYFDQPQFGVIAAVSRLEQPAKAAAQPLASKR